MAVDPATRFRRREAVHRVESNRTRHQESLQSGPHIPVWSASPRRDLIPEECALYAHLLKAVKNRKGLSVWTLFLRYCCLSQSGKPRGKVVSTHVHAFQYVINYTHTFTHRSILLLTYSIAPFGLTLALPLLSEDIHTPFPLHTSLQPLVKALWYLKPVKVSKLALTSFIHIPRPPLPYSSSSFTSAPRSHYITITPDTTPLFKLIDHQNGYSHTWVHASPRYTGGAGVQVPLVHWIWHVNILCLFPSLPVPVVLVTTTNLPLIPTFLPHLHHQRSDIPDFSVIKSN